MKEFDINLAKQGKPVCTRDGKPARIVCFDRRNIAYPIIALVHKEPFEAVYTYSNKGEVTVGRSNEVDLMMAPVKRKGWINIYRKEIKNNVTDRGSGYIFPTKEQALDTVMSGQGYVTTTEIEWEE